MVETIPPWELEGLFGGVSRWFSRLLLFCPTVEMPRPTTCVPELILELTLVVMVERRLQSNHEDRRLCRADTEPWTAMKRPDEGFSSRNA